MTHKRLFSSFLLVFSLLMITGLLYKFGNQTLRAILLYLSAAGWAQSLVSDMPIARRVASRFIAGATIADVMRVAQQLNKQGTAVTINFLGEHVHTEAEAAAARDEIVRLLEAIHQHQVQANVSIKPSQLGLNIDPQLLHNNLHPILQTAVRTHNKVRIDMEDSSTVDTTLGIYRALRDDAGFGNHVGIVIQAYLHRSLDDVNQLCAEGAWVRLCKGAYAEPPEIAFAEKQQTDVNYIRLMQTLLSAQSNGVYTALATHDAKMIQAAQVYAQAQNIPPHTFEFQMLYGIRRELQEQLQRDGYQVRVYVPYGTAWYPYFMRRLAERPANIWFFISNFIKK